MKEIRLKKKKCNINKLLSYGFSENNGVYEYCTDLLDSQMTLFVSASEDGILKTRLMDHASDEEYVLHLIEGAQGSFVGSVREAFDAVLSDIVERCCDDVPFTYPQTNRLISYIKEKYGDEPEFLWEKYDDAAVLRRKGTGKWYALFMTVPKKKLGLDSDEAVEILDLHMRPDEIDALVDEELYFRGYHMNKRHWYTIILDDSLSFEEICNRVDNSRDLK